MAADILGHASPDCPGVAGSGRTLPDRFSARESGWVGDYRLSDDPADLDLNRVARSTIAQNWARS
jgi:hypothetical protein